MVPKVLSTDLGIPISVLVQTQKGVTAGDSRGAGQGTWIHPKVAISFAQWASAEFVAAVTVGSGTAPQAKKSKEWAVVAFSATTGADGKSRPVTNDLVKVPFHGEMLDAVQASDGHVWASIDSMCDNLTLNACGQVQRLKRLQKHHKWATTCIMHVVAADGKARKTVMLRAKSIPMWLTGIELDRIKDPAVRTKISLYQEEAAEVLARHFLAPKAEPNPAPGLTAADVAAIVVQTLAVVEERSGAVRPAEGRTGAVLRTARPEIVGGPAQSVLHQTPLAVEHLPLCRGRRAGDLRTGDIPPQLPPVRARPVPEMARRGRHPAERPQARRRDPGGRGRTDPNGSGRFRSRIPEGVHRPDPRRTGLLRTGSHRPRNRSHLFGRAGDVRPRHLWWQSDAAEPRLARQRRRCPVDARSE
ncbi:hypothetical protein FTUN_8864 [Frigoriglobus tundricola]|uniref:KilA-N domain-containing protein n=1 Tax=Frigoriglobus tundricola TaxID=2774151 RepID=A0A6M5Z6B5_9BACT|nr:hypothetical protein FTUN_8864 [Frigoriglobus tundricola]